LGGAVILNVGDVVLDRYEVTGGTIGIGGEAAGFRGQDVHTNASVFVKLYHDLSQITNEARAFMSALDRLSQRIRQEGLQETASSLITSGTFGGDIVAIFPFFEGTTLAGMLETKLNPNEIRRIATAIARAVVAIHHAEIWHLDLQPANIMVMSQDKVALIDLDAGAVDHVRFRRPHMQTVGYCSPESCFGDRLDEKADVFSLGCILYTLLFGQPPILASDNYAHRVCRGQFSVPRSQYNTQIINAILSCLHPVAAERFEAGLLLSCLETCPLYTSEGDPGRSSPAVPGLYEPPISNAPISVPIQHSTTQRVQPRPIDADWDDDLRIERFRATSRRHESAMPRWATSGLTILLTLAIAGVGFHYRRQFKRLFGTAGPAELAQRPSKPRSPQRDGGVGKPPMATAKSSIGNVSGSPAAAKPPPSLRTVKNPWVVLVGTSLSSLNEAHRIAGEAKSRSACFPKDREVRPCVKRVARDNSYPILLIGAGDGLSKSEASSLAACLRRSRAQAIAHEANLYRYPTCID
jgi:serine/threonine protein kinase